MNSFVTICIIMVMISGGMCLENVCYFTPNMIAGAGFTNLTTQAYARVNPEVLVGNASTYTIYNSDITSAGLLIFNNDTTAGLPKFEIEFYTEMYDASHSPDQFLITMTFRHLDTSTLTITNLIISIDITSNLEATWGTGVLSGSTLTLRNKLDYNHTTFIGTNNSITMNFVAEGSGDKGKNLPEGNTYIDGTVSFTHNGVSYGLFMEDLCVTRVTELETNVLYEHGFTALVFFVMLFVGIGLTILFIWLFMMIQRRRKSSSVSPSKSEEKRYREKGKKVVMDAKAAMKKGMTNAIKDFSLIEWNDSIVLILSMKDKLHMFREMDNLDILNTIHVDTDLETEQNDQAVQASTLLVQGLRYNGDISKGTEDKASSNMQNKLKEMDRKLDADYKKDLEVVYTDAEAKNKEKLGELMRKHKEQRQETVRVIKDLPEEEKKQMIDLMDQQQQTEENELTFKLGLEQNEEAEKLRKEYSIRKRMEIKDVQQNYIADVIKEGQLDAQKAEWLIKLHKQQQEAIHSKYDEEISKQRMNLEEKLARRRALAHASETQEDDQTEILNTIASLHINLIQKIKKNRQLSSDQIEDYMNKTRLDLQNVKTQMESKKEVQEEELFKRLSTQKRKALAEKINEHQKELQAYINKNKAQQTEGPVDPVSYVDALVDLKSKQRKEINTLENQIDRDHASQLETLRDEVGQDAFKDLEGIEAELIKNLKEDGVRDDAIEKILQKHEQTVVDLREKQLKNRRNQEIKLKEDLARRKREWEQKKEVEKKEQQELREHEAEIVEKLLSSQVSISESEKDRIMKEHEKQMVKLENSLTLSKLKQRRMLEEKIALKRSRQMEELEKKQTAEIVRQRRIAENNGEDEDENIGQQVEMMKRHVQQKISLTQGQQLDMEEELDEIRVEMTKDRAIALKDQEERLGALIASLQMDKARELAKIEEQQKAINNLKSNLMDDLNERGKLSTPECQKILDIHKQDQDAINDKFEGQRAKQEKALRQKLKAKMEQREQTILFKQDEEMQTMIKKVTNKTAAKIRSAILTNKHMIEMEKFRNKMDRDISQTLEDTKRDFEIQKQKIIQEQEFKFISGLVKVGEFSQQELTDVLHMLFPGKTEEHIQSMLSTISDGKTKVENDENQVQSSLGDRIYMDKYSNPTPIHRRGSVMSMSLSHQGSKKKKIKNQFGPQDDTRRSTMKSSMKSEQSFVMNNSGRKQKNYDDYDDDDYYYNRDDSRNRAYSNQTYDQYDDEDNYGRHDNYDNYDNYNDYDRSYNSQRMNGSRQLPPIQNQDNRKNNRKISGNLLRSRNEYYDDDV